jgi:hypothetical protein
LEEAKMMNPAYRNPYDFATLDELDDYGKFISARTLDLEEPDSDEDFRQNLFADWNMYHFQKERMPEKPRTLSEQDVERFVILAANSPFESIDDHNIHQSDTEVRDIMAHVREIDLDFGERFFARLQFLFECSKEEDPDQIAISPYSLTDLVVFFQSLATSALIYPDIVLSPAKNVGVQWQGGVSRRIVIEFLGNGRIQFVIFRPDPNDSKNPIRMSGFSSVRSLLEEIILQNRVDWIFR